MRNKVKALLLAALLTPYTAVLPVQPQEQQWKDISAEIKASAGNGRTSIPAPLYLKSGFPKTIKSINFKNTTYTRVVVSWADNLLGRTIKKDLLINCIEHSYKENDGRPAYWYQVDWPPPPIKRNQALRGHFSGISAKHHPRGFGLHKARMTPSITSISKLFIKHNFVVTARPSLS